MNKSLVCRVLVPTKDADKPFSVSTGYAVKKGIVMLARHTLTAGNRDKKKPIILRWEGIKDENGEFFKRELTESKYEHYSTKAHYDLALLECETPSETPVNLCFLANQYFPQGTQWESYGYPKSQQQENEIDYSPTTVGGTTTSSNSNGVIELDAKTEMKPPEDWAGISGAPIFFGLLLAGVIVEKPIPQAHRLEGISLPYLLQEEVSEFAELLQVSTSEKEEQYFNEALEIINPLVGILKGFLQPETTDAKKIYTHLVSCPIGTFLADMVKLQQQYPNDKLKLSQLVAVLLPHFIDNVVVVQLHQRLEQDVIDVSYCMKQPVEALMAKIDQRAIEVDEYTEDVFRATYSMPIVPESGNDDEQRLKDYTHDQGLKFGIDLVDVVQIPQQTKYLLEKQDTGGLPQKRRDKLEVQMVNLHLSKRKANKPHYYLFFNESDFNNQELLQQYYNELKARHPHCVVIKNSANNDPQLLQDYEDYYDLRKALSPLLMQKDH